MEGLTPREGSCRHRWAEWRQESKARAAQPSRQPLAPALLSLKCSPSSHKGAGEGPMGPLEAGFVGLSGNQDRCLPARLPPHGLGTPTGPSLGLTAQPGSHGHTSP